MLLFQIFIPQVIEAPNMGRTKKEIAKSVKTLLVMLQSIRDQQVTIVLRNDTLVRGTILNVDANMNIELKDAMLEPDLFYCTKFAKAHIQQQQHQYQQQLQQPLCMDIEADDENDNCLSDMDKQAETACPLIKIEEKGEANSKANENEQISNNFDYFVVKGTRIRHIDLPTDCDLVASAKCEIERIRNRRKQWTKRDIVRSS